MAMKWRLRGLDSATAPPLPRNQPETAKLAAKKPQLASRSAEPLRKHWNNCRFLSIMGLMESSRLRRRFAAADAAELSIGSKHVVAESYIWYPCCQSDAVRLHSGRDLRSDQHPEFQAARQGTAGQGFLREDPGS